MKIQITLDAQDFSLDEELYLDMEIHSPYELRQYWMNVGAELRELLVPYIMSFSTD